MAAVRSEIITVEHKIRLSDNDDNDDDDDDEGEGKGGVNETKRMR